ncbi:MAG: hypothetical protein GX224_01410 [Thermoplasmatales archaeon]|nr:hypothetical protein [Thermoplasmatales archaeon]
MDRLRQLVGDSKRRFVDEPRKKFRRHRREDLRDYRKKAPPVLSFAALAAVLFAAMYLYKAFMNVPEAAASNQVGAVGLAMLLMLFFFVMFVRFVISLFSMFSGNRRAWASTVRMCVSYIALVVLGAVGMPLLFGDMEFWGVVIPQYLMVAFMVAVTALMFLPGVRAFFTPAYAEPVGIGGWALFVAGIDPFGARKLRV